MINPVSIQPVVIDSSPAEKRKQRDNRDNRDLPKKASHQAGKKPASVLPCISQETIEENSELVGDHRRESSNGEGEQNPCQRPPKGIDITV